MDSTSEAVTQIQYLTFQLSGEEYAISILSVREIIDFGTVTRVPRTPQFIRGVINLRGSVVPVIDLASKLGLPETVVTNRTCIVIVEVNLEGDRVLMGIVTDEVTQVLDLPSEEIEPPPAFGMQVKVDYLLGIGKVDKSFVLILDIDRVLSMSELSSAAMLAAPSEEETQPNAAR